MGGGSTSKKKRKKGGQHKVPSTRTCVIKHKIFLDPYKFVSDLLQVGVFFRVLSTAVYSNNKTDRHYITEILLKVALNIIALTFYLKNTYSLRG
jgi:hypothetical protein